jgi:periplasmic protein TonB
MPLDADIYGYKEPVAPSLAVSIAMHAALLAFVLFVPHLLGHGGQDWGNNGSGGLSGGAMSAHLVSGIPLPANPNAKPENVLANQSKGLSKSIPAPAAKPEENAIPLPDRNSKVKLTPAKQTAAAENPVTPRTRQTPTGLTPTQQPPSPQTAKVDNAIPYGEGGPVAGPFTGVQVGGSAGGLKFGDAGSGNFGSLYGWYTDVVARKVHQAWESEVSPSVVTAKRVYILFDIARSGAPSNVRIEQSSGIPLLDQSAVRALQRIDTFGPLPQGYGGSHVSVEFWFDYRR